eukprot:Hpha_TRINITY_DN16316_c0_g1::TRINITY_DN16316_c0_g1_i14::g.58617::m.58617
MDLETGFCTNFHVTTAGLGKGQRGTVGFVPIDFQGKQLLLGIGHVNHHPVNGRSLVRNWRYSQFFYAFEPVPPFAIHAKSPEFCFPYEQQHKYNGLFFKKPFLREVYLEKRETRSASRFPPSTRKPLRA